MKGCFVVTAHWLKNSFEHKSSILAFEYFPLPNIATATAALQLRVIADLALVKRVQVITTDSGCEIPGAFREVRESLN